MNRACAMGTAMACLVTAALLTGCHHNSPAAPDTNAVNPASAASDTFSQTIAVTAQSVLRLEGVNGTVRITGSPGTGVATIAGERRVESESAQDAQAHLSLLQVDISTSGNEIIVRTQQPEQTEGRSYAVDYELTLPPATETIVNNTNGAVTLASISGNVRVNVTNGSIDGSLSVPAGGTVTLTTVNGDVVLSVPRSTSAAFSARLTNGTITLTGLTLQNQVSSSTSLQGTLGAGDGTLTLQTTNGSIRVTGG